MQEKLNKQSETLEIDEERLIHSMSEVPHTGTGKPALNKKTIDSKPDQTTATAH